MPKRLTYEYVKLQIENVKGYKLLSTEYINNSTKLKVRCNKNHIYKVTYRNWSIGQRCPVCGIESRKKKRRHSYKYVKNYIEKEGCNLLSKKYINNRSLLSIKCNKGHIYKSRFCSFKSGYKCPICANNVKFTYKYVKKQIESIEGYKLLSKNYVNNNTKLKVQCNKGHIYKVKYNNFQQGQRCLKCFMLMKYSGPEKEILDIVKKFTDKLIIENNKTQIVNPKTGYNLELDIWIPELNKAIEFNGKYWHSLKKVKIRDIEKVKQCKQKGIDLLVINEQDWLNNKEKVINKIKRFVANEI